ncbi:Phosphoglycerate mutase-like protein AT74 [Porphyridium purpureum]|uniref:Phosphoglycerate mutase-like protein AT74 n=1 Tax=Porphyridium purpureum TaxID=35688 RepID=A0A5J4YPA4_PORPP|nr:Phosphoglycerate mutase-like protein AT74 [Porphyridium purpureum]|eukprot:POR7413..scf296_7
MHWTRGVLLLGAGICVGAALATVQIDEVIYQVRRRASKYRDYVQNLMRPARIILVRHGESHGNVDKSVFAYTHDSKVLLTTRGWQQARTAGRKLRTILGTGPTCVYLSPYARTKQTLCAILAELDPLCVSKMRYREDPRLRELEFGNLQKMDLQRELMAEREICGRFYYRFPHGESGADVYDRVGLFLASIFRELDSRARPRWQNVVVVAHGLVIRVLLMRYLNWTIAEQFEGVWNPPNCAIWVLEKIPGTGTYRLVTDGIEFGADKGPLPEVMRTRQTWNWAHEGPRCELCSDEVSSGTLSHHRSQHVWVELGKDTTGTRADEGRAISHSALCVDASSRREATS